MFALLTLLGAAQAAPTVIYAHNGYPTYDWSYLLGSGSPYMECSSDWDTLINAHVKSGVSGNDGVDEYTIGWVYPALADQVYLEVFEAGTHSLIGEAWAYDDETVLVSGDVVDIEPVFLDHVSCSSPYRPRWFVRVTTTTDSFLGLVR